MKKNPTKNNKKNSEMDIPKLHLAEKSSLSWTVIFNRCFRV